MTFKPTSVRALATLLLALPLASQVLANDTDPNCELQEVAVGDDQKCALLSNDGVATEICVGPELTSTITLGEGVEPRDLVQGPTHACFIDDATSQVHCHATGKEETYEAKAFKGQGKSDSFVVEKDLLAMYGTEVCGVSKEGDALFLQCGNVSDSKATRKIDIDADFSVASVHVGRVAVCVAGTVKDAGTGILCYGNADSKTEVVAFAGTETLGADVVAMGGEALCATTKEDPEKVTCTNGGDWTETFEFPGQVLQISIADQVDKDGKYTYQACAAVDVKVPAKASLPSDMYCWGTAPAAIKNLLVGAKPTRVAAVTSVRSVKVTMKTMCGLNTWGARCSDLSLATGDLDKDKKPVAADSLFEAASVLWPQVDLECAPFNPLFLIIAGSVVGVLILGAIGYSFMKSG